MEHNTSSPDSADELGSMEHAARLYPSDELLAFNQRVAVLRASHYCASALVACLEAARDIVCTDNNQRQTDMDAVRHFIREDLGHAVLKLLNMGSNSRMLADDADVLDALHQFVHLAAGMLKYRQQQSAAVLSELDTDLALCILIPLIGVFNNRKALYQRVRYTPLPQQFMLKHDVSPDLQEQEGCWVDPKYSNADIVADDDMEEDSEERDAWITHLGNTFGQLDGCSILIEMLMQPAQLTSITLLNAATAVVAQLSEVASMQAREEFVKVMAPVMQHTLEMIFTDSNWLCNHGDDRTFGIFQTLVGTNLPLMLSTCFDNRSDEIPAMEQELRTIYLAFVNKMLDSSSFNKLLAGARQCHNMVEAAIKKDRPWTRGQKAELFKWLQDHQVVQRLLRTGLHHKQYMAEVEGVMTCLTWAQQLTEEHLDLMWAVVEKEDAYDAVKTNMFELLAAVADQCQPSQLDMLFGKLERSQVRNAKEGQRLLTLLAKLAEGDTQRKMKDKIIPLVWELVTPADAAREMLEMDTMHDVLLQYCTDQGDFTNPQDVAFYRDHIYKCFNKIQTGDGGQVALLKIATRLVEELPDKQTLLDKAKCIEALEQRKVPKLLVHTVCSRVAALQEKIAAATKAAASSNGGLAADPASITAAAMAELGEGSWSYADIVKEYLSTLQVLAINSAIYFADGLAEQLWDALMVNPPTWDHLDAALPFFKGGFQGIGDSAPYFDENTQLALLDNHLIKQAVPELTYESALLSWQIFATVNVEVKKSLFVKQLQKSSQTVALNLDGITGLDLMWRIYLTNQSSEVADLLRPRLLHLYHGTRAASTDDSPSIRLALVNNLARHLREAAAGLSAGTAGKAAQAARTVERCLALANQAVLAVEAATMPPVPAHSRAWRGSPVMLEIQREGTNRLRVFTHENEYIGLLRERVARQLACCSKNVRMFCMGQELLQDSRTVQQFGLRNRAALQIMESPEPNRFTKAPSEYKPHYEQSSFVWLLSQADGLYPLLLQFIDAAADDRGIANMALRLLAVLPTHPALSERLAAALDGPDKHDQLAGLLGSNSMAIDAGNKQCTPYQTLYGLQALCALLFPTFDETLLASADREAAAEGSACPSPAAAAPAAPGTAQEATAGAAEAPVQVAEAAAVSAVQHQHHREVQQQEFLHSGGLELVLQAANTAALSSSTDLTLRRQLSELLVVLLHNLLDAAQGWQSVPYPTAGHRAGPAAMSGAESGAGQPAGVARHAAPASSLVGANGTAAQSASMPLADTQPAADAAASSGVAGDSPDGAGPSSKGAATTSDRACHHPASPAMEVSSPAVGQQPQQQLQQPHQHALKQRQRDGDLPPLPPAQLAAANGSSTAVPGPSLAALFSSDTLRLMAETLLQVAVDASQLWGSKAPGAPMPDDDSSKDVAVAREALQLLQRLLEQHPPLLQPLLLDAQDPQLLSVVLLSPYYSTLRRQAAELLEKLVSIDSNRAKLLPWLLTRLVSVAQPLAEQRPSSCAEFYQLLCRMITKLGQGQLLEPEQLFSMAGKMLSDEVQALQAMAATGPPQGPLSPNTKKQQHRRRRRKQPLVSLDDSDLAEDAEEQQESPMSSLLQGRLQLVLALVRLLDRRAVGSQGQGDLIKLLLQDYLFPEAVAKLALASGALNLQRCTASLEPHCATPSSRRAALELLAELMGDTASSLEEGVNMLLHLHYQQTLLKKCGIQPKPLRAPGQYAGLRNGGATCYMNAVFQQLFMQPGIRARILGSAEVPEADIDDSVFAQLQGLFAQLALSKATYAQPFRFWNAFKDYDGLPIDVREHQDAYEFFTRLQDCVDQHLISTSQEPAIKAVMGGTFVQQIICRGHNFTSERNEDFYQISVEVKGMGTLQKSLDDYVKGELMEGDNAYLCEELGKRVPAVKRTAIRTLPQLLCVHLKRFEFDYHNQTRHKLRDRFEFPLELDMFPYTAEGLAAADAQQKAEEEQQQQQQQQEEGQPRPLRTSSGAGAAAGQSVQASNPAYMYDLHGVVVHSGSAFTGHYYSYIKERPGSSSWEQGPRWYLFDDKDVSPWEVSNLEGECFGGKPSQDLENRGCRPPRSEYERAHSAYMLFYERRVAPAASSIGAVAKAASDAAVQQQTRQQGAAAGGDVDMAAAAATPAANGSSNPQQLQRAGISFSIPYNMPDSLFRSVTEANIDLIWQLHVLDKHYFRFIRQLVDSRGDLGQLATRKSRRRDAATGAAAGAALALGAVLSGSSDRVHSSMVCDPSSTQQQAAQCLSTGSGALPMQVSPSPTPAQSVHPPPLDVPGSSLADLQQSPGPSSRRGEEADAVAQALMCLGVQFQFQVYLYAHDSLRSECNVWTEALKSLMGSGSSSTACMQVFLELVLAHPQWLNTFLYDYAGPTSPSSPQAWVCEMLCWTLQAASKRCAHQLQAYVAACLRQHIILGADDGGMGQSSQQQQPGQQQQAERALRQALPPLGQALVGVVEQLVLLVRNKLPRGNQGQFLFPHDPPTEPVRVLLAYAESSPWAAAHLLQVFNVVPDVAEHIVAAVLDPSACSEEQTVSEIEPMYELLDELLPYASNLPQLIRESAQHTVDGPVCPLLKQLSGSGSSPSSSGSNGDGEPSSGGVHAILPAAVYRKMMQEYSMLLKGLAYPDVIRSCKRAAHLAELLTWDNMSAIQVFVQEAQRVLHRNIGQLLAREAGVLYSEQDWYSLCISLANVILLPDQFAEWRVHFLFSGQWGVINANSVSGVREPGLLAYKNAVCFPALGTMKLLGVLARQLAEQQRSQHPGEHQRADTLAAYIGKFVFHYIHRLHADLHQLLVVRATNAPLVSAGRLETVHGSLAWFLGQARAVLPAAKQSECAQLQAALQQMGQQPGQQLMDADGADQEEEGQLGPADADEDLE